MQRSAAAVVSEAKDVLELLGQISQGFPCSDVREFQRLHAEAMGENRRVVKTAVEAKRCAACHTAEAELAAGRSLRKCARCSLVWYCSAECQQQDWRQGHKQVCRRQQ